MVTKKDMVILADKLKRAKYLSEPMSWQYGVAFIMAGLWECNPNFNAKRFMTACEVPKELEAKIIAMYELTRSA